MGSPSRERSDYVPRGLLLQWHVTSRCNLRCTHCYQDASASGELPLAGLLAVLEQYEELLRRWRLAARGTRVRGHVTITGGEPFLRTDIWELLENLAARRRSFTFAVLTNGSHIEASTAQRLRKLEPAFVQVSLEGGPSTHDRIRGFGDFERVVCSIRHLTLARVCTLISFTASRLNYREFPEVARLGRELGVARVWADRLIPVGRGAELHEPLLSPSQTREFFHLMRESRTSQHHRRSPTTEIAMHRALQFLAGGGQPYRCSAGDTLLAVQPDGDVYPCRRLPIRIGNLSRTPLAELYYTSEVLCSLRERRTTPRGCERCPYVKLCGGGLRCLSYAVCGDPFVADPGCWLAAPPQVLEAGPASLRNCRETALGAALTVNSHDPTA